MDVTWVVLPAPSLWCRMTIPEWLRRLWLATAMLCLGRVCCAQHPTSRGYQCRALLSLLASPAIYAYVILKDDCRDSSEAVMDDLVQLVRKKIGPIAVPEKFLVHAHMHTCSRGRVDHSNHHTLQATSHLRTPSPQH